MAKETEQPNPSSPAGLAGHPLHFLQPRQTKRAAKARGQRRLFGGLRFTLPIIAFVALLILVAWPFINPRKIARVAMKNIPDLVVDNLHFTGLDSKNQPYSLSATKATRPGGIQNIYDLDRPEGEMTLTSGAWIAGKAEYGRYDQDTRKLWLGGDVQVFHDKGYQFTTDEAQVDLNDNFAWGEKPVLIQGDFGEIRGLGFKLLDSGSVMIIKGPAHALLYLRPNTDSDKATTNKN
jgi:lipopolysaccharide export system protein LptC